MSAHRVIVRRHLSSSSVSLKMASAKLSMCHRCAHHQIMMQKMAAEGRVFLLGCK